MATKDLKYFMREELKEEIIIDMPGPKTITDENGKPVVFQIKRLAQERINKIFDSYKKTEVAMDKKRKRPYVVDGKVVLQETKDNAKAMRHVLAEALVYPNLKDPELMKFFNCIDMTEMPLKVFTSKEFSEVVKMLNEVLGIENEEEETENDTEEAKN